MAQTEDTTVVDMDNDTVIERRAELYSQKQGMSRQGIIVTAIISSVLLFFVGGGLGFLLGNKFANHANSMQMMNRSRMNNNQIPGVMRRYYQDSMLTTPTTPNQRSDTANP